MLLYKYSKFILCLYITSTNFTYYNLCWSDAEVVITVLTRNQLEALLHVGSNPTHSAKNHERL